MPNDDIAEAMKLQDLALDCPNQLRRATYLCESSLDTSKGISLAIMHLILNITTLAQIREERVVHARISEIIFFDKKNDLTEELASIIKTGEDARVEPEDYTDLINRTNKQVGSLNSLAKRSNGFAHLKNDYMNKLMSYSINLQNTPKLSDNYAVLVKDIITFLKTPFLENTPSPEMSGAAKPGIIESPTPPLS